MIKKRDVFVGNTINVSDVKMKIISLTKNIGFKKTGQVAIIDGDGNLGEKFGCDFISEKDGVKVKIKAYNNKKVR